MYKDHILLVPGMVFIYKVFIYKRHCICKCILKRLTYKSACGKKKLRSYFQIFFLIIYVLGIICQHGEADSKRYPTQANWSQVRCSTHQGEHIICEWNYSEIEWNSYLMAIKQSARPQRKFCWTTVARIRKVSRSESWSEIEKKGNTLHISFCMLL